jgi:hypothetical protein
MWNNGRTEEATHDYIIRRMRFACWITKATETHTQTMQYVSLFAGKNGYANTPQYYVIRKIPVLLFNTSSYSHSSNWLFYFTTKKTLYLQGSMRLRRFTT